VIYFLFPRRVVSAIAGLEEAKNLAGKALRLIQIRLATPSLEKSRRSVNPIRRKRRSPIRVPKTRSTFHRHVQLSGDRRRDVRQEPRLFAPLESTIATQPQLQPALLRLSAMISQYRTRDSLPFGFRSRLIFAAAVLDESLLVRNILADL
jgi:hypothetical protein